MWEDRLVHSDAASYLTSIRTTKNSVTVPRRVLLTPVTPLISRTFRRRLQRATMSAVQKIAEIEAGLAAKMLAVMFVVLVILVI